MKIVSIPDISAGEWDGLIAVSRQGWIFHLRGWIDIEASQVGTRNLSFGIVSKGKLLAAQPLYLSGLGLGPFQENLIHAGLHRHTGLALRPDLSANDITAVRTIAMDAIESAGKRHDADRIYLAHQNLCPESLSSDRQEIPYWVVDRGFQLGASYGPLGLVPGPGLATTIVDQVVQLDVSEEELFGGLEESCRRAVRKGLKAGLSAVELSEDPRCLDEYWRIATLSAQRTGESLPDRRYYEDIRSAFMPRNAFSVLFVKHGEECVAAAILLRDKQACHFLSGVSDPAHLGSRVNDVLHWNAMRYAKQRGDRFYRLGPYFPSLPRGWPVETVTRFKSKFGARPFSIIQGSKFLKPQRYVSLAQEYAARLCAEL